MNTLVKSFSELNTTELYSILQLRSEVFVVEQDCVYQDIDFKDQKALHVLGYKNDVLIAYTRIFKPGDYFDNSSIGRVLVKETERKFNYGHQIMKASLKAIKEYYKVDKITISAQKYLKKFYESHGFYQVNDEYLEDGIPHIRMDRD
ncbi:MULTISPECIES: GNAT family N-acetyltransferase [unclassified Polaribacter]|uniref:GNAT family N-acetyltransferase n=1 Tax=unclassified Polaribacter TaxID=196858 RepID=UPI000068C7C7|nr:GNAT family N-acetyltransferase [Polaribacter sp. MED152]EAQ42798.1 acetyltransferase (GNAT) family protein [Polaribacter sp. MED152]